MTRRGERLLAGLLTVLIVTAPGLAQALADHLIGPTPTSQGETR